jgi:hypothetical protein
LLLLLSCCQDWRQGWWRGRRRRCLLLLLLLPLLCSPAAPALGGGRRQRRRRGASGVGRLVFLLLLLLLLSAQGRREPVEREEIREEGEVSVEQEERARARPGRFALPSRFSGAPCGPPPSPLQTLRNRRTRSARPIADGQQNRPPRPGTTRAGARARARPTFHPRVCSRTELWCGRPRPAQEMCGLLAPNEQGRATWLGASL